MSGRFLELVGSYRARVISRATLLVFNAETGLGNGITLYKLGVL